ncbi:membrane protein [Marinithermofilum abyssi]|uniref:Membrane protein n=1 Tax=Marinithermofilum abyssi TaxID=1571185 RepID=A0A8J2VIH1_9BACL|nr:PepSY domain-containing protein [Marinithermofilum abyssi]GGE22245.1 membrane protein [Marinithermofilum abyssi]
MQATLEPQQRNAEENDASKFYQTIWRWHFYAGLIFAPFFILLAISGSVYLFKPQIESWLYKDYYYVSAGEKRLAPSEQMKRVTQQYPKSQVTSFTEGIASNRSTEIGIMNGGQMSKVYVNPYNGKVLGKINDDDRLLEKMKSIHNGELWGGTFGNRIVELAACWAFILVLTGMYLWWPRNRKSWWGTFLPRLKKGKRIFWRDMHAVPAFWLSALLIIFIFTGLPWSGVWGEMVNKAATATHTGYPAFAFSFGPKPESTVPKTKDVAKDVAWAAENMPVPKSSSSSIKPLSLNKVAAIAKSKQLEPGYTIYLPEGKKGVYTLSTNPDRPQKQATLHVDQYSGKTLADLRFNDYGPVAKAISIGIALHQGTYFGLANQIMGVLACLGLIGLVATGVTMWWKRRPQGKLGAPQKTPTAQTMKSGTVILMILGIFFPLVGLSLIIVLLLDWLIIRRIPSLKQWAS